MRNEANRADATSDRVWEVVGREVRNEANRAAATRKAAAERLLARRKVDETKESAAGPLPTRGDTTRQDSHVGDGFEYGREVGWPGLGYVFTAATVAGVGFTIGAALTGFAGALLAAILTLLSN